MNPSSIMYEVHVPTGGPHRATAVDVLEAALEAAKKHPNRAFEGVRYIYEMNKRGPQATVSSAVRVILGEELPPSPEDAHAERLVHIRETTS